MQLRELFLGLELSGIDTLLLFAYLTPFFMLIVIPLACMVSVFLTFLRMSTDRELLALKAGGVSIYQLLPAPLLFAALCTCLSAWVSLYGLSWGMEQFRSTVLNIANTRAKLIIQPGVFNQDIFGLTLFARQVDPKTGQLQQIIFEDNTGSQTGKNTEESDLPPARVTILAPTGDIVTDRDRGDLVFSLYNGRIYRIADGQITIMSFQEYTVRLDLAGLFSGVTLGEIRPKEMPWKSLRALYKKGVQEGKERDFNKVLVEMHKRWVFPTACLILGFFAVPLACSFGGVSRQMGALLPVFAFMVYYALLSVGLNTGEAGSLPPIIGMWIANAFFLILGSIGIYLTAQERLPSLLPYITWLRHKAQWLTSLWQGKTA